MDSRRTGSVGSVRRVVSPYGGGYGAGTSEACGERVITVTPFECKVAGVTLKLLRDPCERTATLVRRPARGPGPEDEVRERAVDVVARWMEQRLHRFLGEGWRVVRGEGW